MSADPLGDLVDVFRSNLKVGSHQSEGARLRDALAAVERAVNHRWLEILQPGALMCGCGDIVDTDHQCGNCDAADWAAGASTE